MERIEKSILATLAWFDVFDYPVTSEELYKHLWKDTSQESYANFLHTLDAMEGKKSIQREYGFYFLPGRTGLVEKRQEKIALIEHKMRIAQKATNSIRFIPFVESIFLCNTVAFGWPKEESDVDVFIIISKGRLWLARFLVTIALSIKGLRRNKKHIADKVCLSFYITDDALTIKDLALDNEDIYLVYWMRYLIPLYTSYEAYLDFQAANAWATQYTKPLPEFHTLRRYNTAIKKVGAFFKYIFEKVWTGAYGNLIETQAKKIQQTKMNRNTSSVQGAGDTRVVISDTRLKFHENDRRELYRQMWKDRLKTLKISI